MLTLQSNECSALAVSHIFACMLDPPKKKNGITSKYLEINPLFFFHYNMLDYCICFMRVFWGLCVET